MQFSTAQARFAAYYVMAWGTEASKYKNPYVFTPAMTKTTVIDGITKTTRGGTSLGVFQIDLGVRSGNAKELQLAYDKWRLANGKDAIALADLTSMGVDLLLGPKAMALNEFLSTASGKAIVDGWTAKEANYLIAGTAPSARIGDTTYFSFLNEDQQLAVAAAIYKAVNARGPLPGTNLINFMNGDTVNGIKIDLRIMSKTQFESQA